MPELLPYRDGSRQCQPVKCVMFFKNAEAGKVIVKVIFTDQENEKIFPRDPVDPLWKAKVDKTQSKAAIAKFKDALAALGYQISEKAKHPTYCSFYLQPSSET